MLAIVFATEEESLALRRILGKASFYHVGNVDIYTYEIDNNLCYLFHTGVGKVNAASVLSKILTYFSIDHVLNIGVAGGIGEQLHVGDLVLAKQIAYWDVDLTFFNEYKCGQLPNTPGRFNCVNDLTECCATVLRNQNLVNLHEGLITTGDRFIDNNNFLTIKQLFVDCLAVDMEAGAYAHVCYVNKIIFSSLKIISDLPAKPIVAKSYSQSVMSITKKIVKFVPDVVRYFFYTNSRLVV